MTARPNRDESTVRHSATESEPRPTPVCGFLVAVCYWLTLLNQPGLLITSLEDAQQAGHLQHRMKTLGFPSLLVVDEIGYLPVSRTGAMLFFQLMARRYEHASTVLTSNKSFAEWGEIFGDEVMAAALIDRLVHHCHIVNIRGNSYRMRHHQDLHRALGTPRHPPARSPQRTARSASTSEDHPAS